MFTKNFLDNNEKLIFSICEAGCTKNYINIRFFFIFFILVFNCNAIVIATLLQFLGKLFVAVLFCREPHSFSNCVFPKLKQINHLLIVIGDRQSEDKPIKI